MVLSLTQRKEHKKFVEEKSHEFAIPPHLQGFFMLSLKPIQSNHFLLTLSMRQIPLDARLSSAPLWDIAPFLDEVQRELTHRLLDRQYDIHFLGPEQVAFSCRLPARSVQYETQKCLFHIEEIMEEHYQEFEGRVGEYMAQGTNWLEQLLKDARATVMEREHRLTAVQHEIIDLLMISFRILGATQALQKGMPFPEALPSVQALRQQTCQLATRLQELLADFSFQTHKDTESFQKLLTGLRYCLNCQIDVGETKDGTDND